MTYVEKDPDYVADHYPHPNTIFSHEMEEILGDSGKFVSLIKEFLIRLISRKGRIGRKMLTCTVFFPKALSERDLEGSQNLYQARLLVDKDTNGCWSAEVSVLITTLKNDDPDIEVMGMMTVCIKQ